MMSSLEQCPLEKAQYIKKELYSNFATFEIASLPNVPRNYLRKFFFQVILSSKKAPSVQKCILSRRGLLTSSCPTVKWLQVFLTVNFQKKNTKNIFYKVGNLKSVYVCVYVYNTSFYIQFCCPKFLQLGNLAKISFFFTI